MNSDALAYLADKGLSLEEIIEFARLTERKSDPTNAARQARHRERKRNGVTITGVTPLPPVPLDKEIPPTPPKEINPHEPPSPDDCPAGAEPALKPEHVVEKWNEIAPAIGKPPIRKLTPERREAVKARINQNSIDDFVTVFGNIRGSPFLQEWRGMGFDWVMKKSNFQKVLEGNYNG